jgi:hypothetical protein
LKLSPVDPLDPYLLAKHLGINVWTAEEIPDFDPACLKVLTEDGLLILNMFDKRQEEEAKWLSGCLLLPRDALLLIRREKLSKETAAGQFGVSAPMLTFRLNMTRLGPQFNMRGRTPSQH